MTDDGRPGHVPCTLDDVAITDTLARDPSRSPDFRGENAALSELAAQLADDPGQVLQRLADITRHLCRADSVGVMLLDDGQAGRMVRCVASAGEFVARVGDVLERASIPCGAAIDRDTVLLLDRPGRAFPALARAAPPVHEALVMPIHAEGRPVGTVWTLSHQAGRRFEQEDVRLLTNLSHVASASYRVTKAARADTDLRDSRTAALNLMEDAIESRRDADRANQTVRASEEKYRLLFESIDEGVGTIELVRGADDQVVDYVYLEHNPAFERLTGLSRDAIGKPISEVVPGLEPFWFDIFERVARTGEGERFEHAVAGLGRWFEVYVSRIAGPGSQRLAYVYNNITDRKRAEERQAFLLALSDELRPLSDLEAIRSAAMQLMGRHLHVNRAVYVDAEGEADSMRVVSTYTQGVAPWGGTIRLADFGAALTEEFLRGKSVAIADIDTDPRFEDSRDAYRALEIGAAVGVPHVKGGRVVAAMGVQSKAPRRWTADEIDLIERVAERTWATVERARAEAELRRAHDELEQRVRARTADLATANTSLQTEVQERRAAESQIKALFERLVSVQEEERLRIARDIHDQLGQQMTALRMNIEALRLRSAGQSALVEQAERTQRLAEHLDQSIDALTWELRPAALEHLGLSAALRNLVGGWSERFGVPVEFDTTGLGEVRLRGDAEAHLYRITQEGLHNVAKHAAATQVTVQLTEDEGSLVLLIEDNGRGLDPQHRRDAEAGGGLGLVSMRERAALAGGELEIESEPGRGTSLYVRIPQPNA